MPTREAINPVMNRFKNPPQMLLLLIGTKLLFETMKVSVFFFDLTP